MDDIRIDKIFKGQKTYFINVLSEVTPRLWQKYIMRNKVANQLKSAKKKYLSHMNLSDPKLFWKTVKQITKEDSRIPCIEGENGDIISNDELKASILNNYFSKCFNNTIPPLTDGDRATYQHTCSSEYPEHLLCSEDEVLSLLLSLDITKANGPDGVSANMLKNTACSIVEGVTIIFNLSLKNGELPTK
ncbi:MAG: hypothetical protein MJE68_09765 [Proteobacteria bacterium]|nr:hypothetical protein [Pseudomonadota bacterium]